MLAPKCHYKKSASVFAGVFLAAVSLAVFATPVIADITMWTNQSANGSWSDTSNWDTHTLPGSSNTAAFDNRASGTVILGGTTQTINTLRFTNTADPYTITNGTFCLNTIESTNFPSTDANTISASLQSAASNLTFNFENSGLLHLPGQINATNLTINNAMGTALNGPELTNVNNAIIGDITLNPNAALYVGDPGSLGTAAVHLGENALVRISSTLSAPTYTNAIITSATRSTVYAQAPYGETISLGTLTLGGVNPSTTYVYDTGYANTLSHSSVIMSGQCVFMAANADSDKSLILGAVGEAVGHPGAVLRFSGADQADTYPGVHTSGWVSLALNQTSTYTGGTFVDGGRLVLNAQQAAGTGSITVNANAGLHFAVTQSTFPTCNINAGGALLGHVEGAIYSGARQNIFLAPDAILGVADGSPLPARGAAASYYLAVTDQTAVLTVGDDGVSIFKGAAFGPTVFTPAGPFYGVLQAPSGQSLQIYLGTGTQMFSGPTFDATSEVRFSGPGEAHFLSASSGRANTLTFTGSSDHSTQGRQIVTLDDQNTLKTGQTLNVSHGVFYATTPLAVSSNAVVNIGDGGTYWSTSIDPNDPSRNQTTGHFNILPGGGVFVSASTAALDTGAVFNFSPGSLLILATSMDTAATWLPSAADVIVESSDPVSLTGAGIKLGQQRRLTTPADQSVTLQQGTGISAQSGTNRVLLTASSFAPNVSLTIMDDLNLSGVDLQIGDPANFTTVVAPAIGTTNLGTLRQSAPQAGQVQLFGANNTSRDLAIIAGTLVFGDDVGDSLTLNSLTHSSSQQSTLQAGTVTLTSALTVTAGTLQIQTWMNYGPAATISVSGGGILCFQDAQSPTFSDGLTINVGPQATLQASGSGDPFTDFSSMQTSQNKMTAATTTGIRHMRIANQGLFSVSAGNMTVDTITGVGTVSLLSGSTPATLIATQICQNSLQLGDFSLLQIAPRVTDATSRNTLNNLSLTSTASLDLTNNSLVVQASDPAAMYKNLWSWLATARNNGNWNGPGINSSTAADLNTLQSHELYGLVLADNAQLHLANFSGQPVDPKALLIKFTYVGDANLDGQITMDDYLALDTGYLFDGSGYTQGDFNYDGLINADDYRLIDYACLHQSTTLVDTTTALSLINLHASWFGPSYLSMLDTPIPEPASLTLLGLGALTLTRRRGR